MVYITIVKELLFGLTVSVHRFCGRLGAKAGDWDMDSGNTVSF